MLVNPLIKPYWEPPWLLPASCKLGWLMLHTGRQEGHAAGGHQGCLANEELGLAGNRRVSIRHEGRWRGDSHVQSRLVHLSLPGSRVVFSLGVARSMAISLPFST